MQQINRKCIIILFLISLFALKKVNAQTSSEISLFKNEKNVSSKVDYQQAKHNKNELETVFSGLFLGYKYLVSSQDINSCVFTPSCSEYALLAIKQKGLVKGSLSAFDRLTRCNGLSAKNYKLSKDSFHLVDSLTSY